MRTYIKTYGCTLNQADSDIMKSLLKSSGIESAARADDADVVVLNTCTVKRPTEQRILDTIDRLNKHGAKLVIAGCMAGANPDVVRKHAPGATMVTTANVHRIVSAVMEAHMGRSAVYSKPSATEKPAYLDPSGVVARVPASEGCISSCSFCETKFARGKLHSFPDRVIIRAVENSVKSGAKEVQLTSQDMGAYGADSGTDIAELMGKISQIKGDFRVRVGMLNPDHLGGYIDRLIDAFNSDGRFYRFVHLPVQSGSDSVLKSMGRKCTAGTFAEYARKLRRGVKGISIETDIIVGYPTESEGDFDRTVNLVEEARPDITNVSRFWVRHHARASRMKQLSAETIKNRSMVLSRKVRGLQKTLNSAYVGTNVRALMTERTETSLNGRTDSYKQVVVQDSNGAEPGSYMDLSVYAASCNVLYCRVG